MYYKISVSFNLSYSILYQVKDNFLIICKPYMKNMLINIGQGIYEHRL